MSRQEEPAKAEDKLSQINQNVCQQVNDLEEINTPPNEETFNYFTILPPEILCRIFELCALKEQLVVAKVCKTFRRIICNICHRKHKNFIYDYLLFTYTLNLDEFEVSELCYLCGKAVEAVRFNTCFSFDMLKHLNWSCERTNPVENIKAFINNNFTGNVKYFTNLQHLEVQGKFLQDETILELAKHCRKLKSLQLLDGDNRWLKGKHLADLESIELLELKACRNLDPEHLLNVCQKRHLKALNVAECEYLKDIPKILELSAHWQYLETLKLTAFTQDNTFLNCIIDLPNLKSLQFFWINFLPVNFEENFFLALQNHKSKSVSLKCIKFENDRHYLEDQSLHEWTPECYATMRENVCVNGQSWQWSNEVFAKILNSFKEFKNLRTLKFIYCRLLSYDQLKQLPLHLTQLEKIQIFGCPRADDKRFHKHWLEDEQQQLASKCQLDFESVLTLDTVINLYLGANLRQFSSYYRREPVNRSIECQFG